jgi:hypothetical protein
MHDRPPAQAPRQDGTQSRPGTEDAARKRKLRRERKRRRAKRAAAGLACCTVEHDATMLQFLIATRWLEEADADDPDKVGAAVSAMWRQAAENN